jgi:D-alanyl-D-alanine carboxypeptidase
MRSNTGKPLRRRLSLFGIIFAFALLLSPATHAKYASFVIDAKTGRILHASNADTLNYPASLTKMMTLYLIFEALDTGKVTLQHRFRASARAARQPSSKLALKRGQTITVKQAILALVTKSANDVASMMAEGLGRTELKFALIMTAKARQIGMSRTTFRNASGLPHSGQKSTARDMATLARRLLVDYPHYYHYFSRAAFNYGGLRHKNHNKLLKQYPGTDGIKTGYIRASGFNLVASVVRNGHRLIGVVFGGRSPRKRDRHMMALLDKGFLSLNSSVLVARNTTAPKPRHKKQRSKPATPQTVGRTTGAYKDKNLRMAWAVQVGAYSLFKQAMNMAKKVITKFPGLLKDGTARVDPLKLRRKRRPVYRARIVGLEKKQAHKACYQIKRRKIDCLAVRLNDLQLAYFAN